MDNIKIIISKFKEIMSGDKMLDGKSELRYYKDVMNQNLKMYLLKFNPKKFPKIASNTRQNNHLHP